jgi:hypothetical protein
LSRNRRFYNFERTAEGLPARLLLMLHEPRGQASNNDNSHRDRTIYRYHPAMRGYVIQSNVYGIRKMVVLNLFL